MRENDILYSISVADVQEVAKREFDMRLGRNQVRSVTDKLGDYIDWYETVNCAIEQTMRDAEVPRDSKKRNRRSSNSEAVSHPTPRKSSGASTEENFVTKEPLPFQGEKSKHRA